MISRSPPEANGQSKCLHNIQRIFDSATGLGLGGEGGEGSVVSFTHPPCHWESNVKPTFLLAVIYSMYGVCSLDSCLCCKVLQVKIHAFSSHCDCCTRSTHRFCQNPPHPPQELLEDLKWKWIWSLIESWQGLWIGINMETGEGQWNCQVKTRRIVLVEDNVSI